MKAVGTLAFLFFTFVMPSTGFTQASSVDWRLYGAASVHGDSLCFYEATSVALRPEDHIRVWTKCLPLESVDKFQLKEGSIQKAAKKIARGYVPAIVTAGVMTFDQIPDIAESEEVANTDLVQPQTRIFYELDCPERRLQELSIYIEATGSRDTPGPWRHVAPEGSAATLMKILCPPR
jgi:hypothetical protein